MIRLANKNVLLRPFLWEGQVRSVVITRNKRDNRLVQLRERSLRRKEGFKKVGSKRRDEPKLRESAAAMWLRKDKEREIQKESSELGRNIKQLREFTEKLKRNTQRNDDISRRDEVQKELEIVDDSLKLLDQDIDVLVDEVIQEEQNDSFLQLPASDSNDLSHLFEYAENEVLLKLPPTLIDKIGDSIKYIRNQRTLNWELMIRDMAQKNGLQNMDKKEVSTLIMNIPKTERHKSVSFINEMMFDAGIEKDLLIYNLFLTAYASDSRYEILCESFFEELKAKNLKPDLYTFSSLVKSHGISDNIDKINETLSLMRNEYNLEPNRHIYTSVLQTCVRLHDHRQAAEVFDMMKFLSKSTQPDAKTYESIILGNVEDDNVERALDLYDEMHSKPDSPITPTGETILMLARGCASREVLLNRGWEFIFEYHDKKFQPNSMMLETMMYLAAKDGDVSFTRALFNTIMESKFKTDSGYTPGSVPISLLMLSYAKFRFDHTPVSVLNERVRTLRSRTIDMTTFNFQPPRSPPFLPIDDIKSDKSIIAESNAIWAYIVLNYRDLINEKVIGSFLFAATSKGNSISEFIRRFETVTYLDEAGIPVKEDSEGNTEAGAKVEIIEDEISPDPLVQALKTLDREPPAVKLSYSSSFKIARTNEFYNIAIVAAKHFGDLDFATRIWRERGEFRKSTKFKSLSYEQRHNSDFEFAQYMLSFFTDMRLLEDLTMIVLSTQNQFNWEWSHVKTAYQLAEISGNSDVKSYLSAAVNNKNYKLRKQNSYIHPETK